MKIAAMYTKTNQQMKIAVMCTKMKLMDEDCCDIHKNQPKR